MARAFRCKECGTGYTTTGNDVPPSPQWNDGHVCEMTEVESKLNVKLTYEERIRWFVANYYETGMEYIQVLESFRDSDLDNLQWHNEIISIPKYRHEVDPGFYQDSSLEEAYDKGVLDSAAALGVFEPTKMNIEKMKSYKLVKKTPPFAGYSEFSDEEKERERRMRIIAQNGNDGLHY